MESVSEIMQFNPGIVIDENPGSSERSKLVSKTLINIVCNDY